MFILGSGKILLSTTILNIVLEFVFRELDDIRGSSESDLIRIATIMEILRQVFRYQPKSRGHTDIHSYNHCSSSGSCFCPSYRPGCKIPNGYVADDSYLCRFCTCAGYV